MTTATSIPVTAASPRRSISALRSGFSGNRSTRFESSAGATFDLSTPAFADRSARAGRRRGRPDLFGRRLEVSVIGFADEVAAAASLLMGQGDEALPAVLIRGLRWSAPESTAASIIRSSNEDLFR
jgi:F420-0:Gamma-glutamyl ligase